MRGPKGASFNRNFRVVPDAAPLCTGCFTTNRRSDKAASLAGFARCLCFLFSFGGFGETALPETHTETSFPCIPWLNFFLPSWLRAFVRESFSLPASASPRLHVKIFLCLPLCETWRSLRGELKKYLAVFAVAAVKTHSLISCCGTQRTLRENFFLKV